MPVEEGQYWPGPDEQVPAGRVTLQEAAPVPEVVVPAEHALQAVAPAEAW